MRIGVIGYGYIGRYIVRRIRAGDASAFRLAFVYNRSARALQDLDPGLRLEDLREAESRRPDLIVECAHPSITVRHGAAFLGSASYMPLSVTALAEDRLRQELEAAARAGGNRLFVPVGALLGGEELRMRSGRWAWVRITFRKHPDNIDFSESGLDPRDIAGETVIHEGSVRSIAHRFPRNVNTMVTCALVSTGLDACEARLICDPELQCAVAEVEARDVEGGVIRTEKRQPLVGVSGTEMLYSTWSSLLRAAGAGGHSIELV